MPQLLALFPLAQMNTSTGGAGVTSAPAPVAPPATIERAAAPATAAAGNATAVTGEPGAPATGSAATAPATQSAQGGILGAMGGILPMILILVVLYFVLFRGQRKEEKRRKNLVAELKKGDRVMTIGGMLARVVSIEGDEVVLKVDESANVKATYRKSAIQEVIDRDEKK